MFANALIVTFITSFIAVAVFGHVLLFLAIWPQLAVKRRKLQPAEIEFLRFSSAACRDASQRLRASLCLVRDHSARPLFFTLR